MEASSKAIDLIKQFEGFRAKAYLCPSYNLTIGYGHVIIPSLELELETKTITQEEAEHLLQADLKYFAGYLNEICNQYQVTLKQQQFDALCSFTFNLGTFKGAMLERFKIGDLTAIGNSLILYNKAGGKALAGLTMRRKAEQELFFS